MQNVICPNLLTNYELVEICKKSKDEFLQEIGIRLEGSRNNDISTQEYLDDLTNENEDLNLKIFELEDEIEDKESEIERLKDRIMDLEDEIQELKSNS